MKLRVREIRKQRGLSLAQVADRCDSTADHISKIERGLRPLTSSWMEKLSYALNCRPQDLISEDTVTVPVVGKVGGGYAVYWYDDHAPGAGLEEVPCPPGMNPATTVGFLVEGDSMIPMCFPGWLIFTDQKMPPTETILRTVPYIVMCEDGNTLVKMVRPGRKPGTFDLISVNNAMHVMEDVPLKWVARIGNIQPR